MNRFSIIGEFIDASELRNAGPKKTPVITVRFKTGASILKIAFWGKKALEMSSKHSVSGLCFSVVGWLDINSWEYNDRTYAELKGTADTVHPIDINIPLMASIEIIGSVIKDYGEGNYLIKTTSTTKGKKFNKNFTKEFIPFHCNDDIVVGQIVHILGSLRSDTYKQNISRQTVEAARVIKF